MPKGRYAIMRRYMPTVGTLGPRHDDAHLHGAGQPRLFASEADMARKMRVALAFQPVATALFANSPFTEGKPNGYLSLSRACLDRYRQPALRHARGVFFDEDFGFERYVEWLLDVPMYFVYRDGRYIDRGRPVVPRVHGGPASQLTAGPGDASAISPTT